MNAIWQLELATGDTPKYLALAEAIRRDVRANLLRPGEKLPPVRDLAWRIGVTPGTVARAYRQGIDQGLLTASVGRGTFVSVPGNGYPAGGSPALADSDPEKLDLRTCVTPNVGQDEAIAEGLARLSATRGRRYIEHPRAWLDVETRQAGRGQAARDTMQCASYGLSQIIADLGTELITSGQAEHFRTLCHAAIAARVRLTVEALGKWDIRWREDAPFCWIRLPSGWRASGFAAACERSGIQVRPADEFVLSDGHAPNAVRIAVNCNVAVDDFEEGLHTITGLLATPPLIQGT